MDPASPTRRLNQYTKIVLSTIEGIAQSYRVPVLTTIATLSLGIVTMIESVRTNKKLCNQIADDIHRVLCNIVKFYVENEIDGVIPPKLLHDIASLAEILQTIFSCLKLQQGIGRFKALFKQMDNKIRLEQCVDALSVCVKMFDTEIEATALSSAVQMKIDALARHGQFLALLENHPDLDSSTSQTSTISTYGSSSDSLSLLPARPQIFHGRESELQDIVDCLTEGAARIVILGAGGVGKTALALTAMYHPQVSAKYDNIYFISCQSSPTCSHLAAKIASHLHIEQTSNLEKAVVQHLSSQPSSVLLVLDNFETPWENMDSRRDTEEFLSLLTDVPKLTLMITMRGAERPGKVQWSRPFLPALSPLNDSAAIKTFYDIAGDLHDSALVERLLQLTGNLPLALSLMAHVAATDGCDNTLRRWTAERTRLFSDGYDHTSSLDISVALSYTSPRMTSGAQELLSVLVMLPDGISDTDLVQSRMNIPNILARKTTLIQTALAHVDQHRVLKVLPPIRESVARAYPAKAQVKSALCQHFRSIIGLCKERAKLSSQSYVQLQRNLANFDSMFLDALATQSDDIEATLESVVLLVGIRRGTEMGRSILMVESSGLGLNTPDFISQGNAYFDADGVDISMKAKWYRACGHERLLRNVFLGALPYFNASLSLVEQNQLPTPELADALYCMGQVSGALGQ
ncbi:P-loop containing nucleoside triphosphate hydrolase protein [Mycena metata]|uniref:P-loop containing nucleoside triphosphate hydrolase protein n=1 Tax=Mycena metata TaxID=1033252 RepID=A0AAD7MM97_9AGAR|nr:P-loop containing nucleoside triphosphate hydrolase protein [Mycena metata]